MELIIAVVLIVIVSALIMIGTNILYDLAAVIIPLLAVLMVAVGIVVGLFVALKNTFTVYKNVYMNGGRRK